MASKVLKWFLVLLIVEIIVCTNLKCEASMQQTGPIAFKDNAEFSSNVTEKKKAVKKETVNVNEPRLQSVPVELVADQRCYQVIFNHILNTAPGLEPEQADWITLAILESCIKYQVDPLLATALFTQESGFNMYAISCTGAVGIAQLQPETARWLGVDPFDMYQNIEGGIYYLADQLNTFAACGEWASTFAIAAYNAGPGAVTKYGGVPPYDETINHVERVGAILGRLLNEYGSV